MKGEDAFIARVSEVDNSLKNWELVGFIAASIPSPLILSKIDVTLSGVCRNRSQVKRAILLYSRISGDLCRSTGYLADVPRLGSLIDIASLISIRVFTACAAAC